MDYKSASRMRNAVYMYAKYLGIDAEIEPDLVYIAQRALQELPENWELLFGEDDSEHAGIPYFYDNNTEESSWTHPNEEKFSMLVSEERIKKIENSHKSDKNTRKEKNIPKVEMSADGMARIQQTIAVPALALTPATPGHIKEINFELLESAERDKSLLKVLELQFGSAPSTPMAQEHINYGSVVDDDLDSDRAVHDSSPSLKQVILLESKYCALEKELARKQEIIEKSLEEERRRKLSYFLESERFQVSPSVTNHAPSSSLRSSPATGIDYERNVLQRLQNQLLHEVVNFAKLEASFDRSQEELATAEHALKKSAEEISGMQSERLLLQVELNDMRLEQKTLQQALLQSREDVAKKVKMIYDMQLDSDAKALEFKTLSDKNDAICVALRQTISEMESNAASLVRNLEEYKVTSQTLSSELALRTAEIQTLQSDRALLEDEVNSLKVFNHALADQVSGLKEIISITESSLKEVTSDKDSIRELLCITESESSHWQEKFLSMEKLCHDLKEDIGSCEFEAEAIITAAKVEISRFSAQTEAIQANFDICQEDLKQALRELIKVEAERDVLKTTLTSEETKWTDLEKRISLTASDKNTELFGLQEELDTAKSRLISCSSDLSLTLEKLELMKVDLSRSEGINDATLKDLVETRNQLHLAEQNVEDLTLKLAESYSKLDALQNENLRLEEQLLIATSRISKHFKEISEMILSPIDDEKDIVSLVDSMKSENLHLKSLVEMAANEKSTLDDNIQQMRSTLSRNQEEVAKKQSSLTTLELTNRLLTEKLLTAESSVQESFSQKDKATDELSESLKQNENLLSELEVARTVIESLNKNFHEREAKQDMDVDTINCKMEALEKELNLKASEIESLTVFNTSLSEEIKRLQDTLENSSQLSAMEITSIRSETSALSKEKDDANFSLFQTKKELALADQEILTTRERNSLLQKETRLLKESEESLKENVANQRTDILKYKSDMDHVLRDLGVLLDTVKRVTELESEAHSSVASFADIYMQNFSVNFSGSNPLHEDTVDVLLSNRLNDETYTSEQSARLLLHQINEVLSIYHCNMSTRVVDLSFELNRTQKQHSDTLIELKRVMEITESQAMEIAGLSNELSVQQSLCSEKSLELQCSRADAETLKIEISKMREALLQSEQELMIAQISMSSPIASSDIGNPHSVCSPMIGSSSAPPHISSPVSEADPVLVPTDFTDSLATPSKFSSLEGLRRQLIFEQNQKTTMKSELDKYQQQIESLKIELTLMQNIKKVGSDSTDLIESRDGELENIVSELSHSHNREANLQVDLQNCRLENESLRKDLNKVREALLQSEQELILEQMSNASHSANSFSLTSVGATPSAEQRFSERTPTSDITLSPHVNLSSEMQLNEMSVQSEKSITSSASREKEKEAIKQELITVHEQVDALSLEVDVLKIEVDALRDIVAAREKDLLVATNENDVLNEKLMTGRAEVIKLQELLNESESKITILQEQLSVSTSSERCLLVQINELKSCSKENDETLLKDQEVSRLSAEIDSLNISTDALLELVALKDSALLDASVEKQLFEDQKAENESLQKDCEDLKLRLNEIMDEIESTRSQFAFIEELLATSETELKRVKVELKDSQKLLRKAKADIKKNSLTAKASSESGTKSVAGSFFGFGRSKGLDKELEKVNIELQSLKGELKEAYERITEQESEIASLKELIRTEANCKRAIDFDNVVEQNRVDHSLAGPDRSPGLPARLQTVLPNPPSRSIPQEVIANQLHISNEIDHLSPPKDIFTKDQAQNISVECSREQENFTSLQSCDSVESINPLNNYHNEQQLGEHVKILEDEIRQLNEKLKCSIIDLENSEKRVEVLENQLRRSQTSADALLQTSMVFEEKLKKVSSYSEAEKVFLRTIFMENKEILDTIDANLQNEIEKMHVYAEHLKSITDPRGEFFQLKYEGLLNEVFAMLMALTASRQQIVMYGQYVEEKILSTSGE